MNPISYNKLSARDKAHFDGDYEIYTQKMQKYAAGLERWERNSVDKFSRTKFAKPAKPVPPDIDKYTGGTQEHPYHTMASPRPPPPIKSWVHRLIEAGPNARVE